LSLVDRLSAGEPSSPLAGQDPVKILSPYVGEGMTVLEPGPAMGFFTPFLSRALSVPPDE
jgi:hypothetical protein